MPGVNTMSKSVSGFDPRSIPGCTLWLDAADPNVFTFSSGTNISTWRDKTSNGTIVSVDTGTPQLTQFNNLNSVYFNGSTRMISSSYNKLAGATNINWFVVANIPNVNLTYGLLIGTQYSADFFSQNSLYVHSNNLLHFFRQSYGTSGNSVSRIVANGPFLGSTYTNLSNGTYSVYVNAVGSTSTGGATGTQDSTTVNLYLGNDNYPDDAFITGNICECILYTSDITTSQRQSIEGYLAWKWRLEIAPTFLPTSIPGCILWFDAYDSSSIIRSGTTVTQILDKSGLGNHTTTASGTSSYTLSLNSLPTISITGGGFFTGTFASAITNTRLQCFIVGTINSASGQFARMLSLGLLGTTDAVDASYAIPFVRGNGTASVYSVRNNVANPVSPYIPITYDTPFLAQSAFDGTNMYTSVNGGTIYSSGSTGSFNISGFGLGTNCDTTDTGGKLTGYISEVLVFADSIFTEEQRSLVEGYLANKWKLSGVPSSSLPSTHPFASYPPLLRIWSPSDLGTLPQYWFDAADRSRVFASGTNLTNIINKGSAGSAGNVTVKPNGAIPTTGTIRRNGNNLINCAQNAVLQFTATYPNQTRSRFFAIRPLLFQTMSFLTTSSSGSGQDNIEIVFSSSYNLRERADGLITNLQTGAIPAFNNVFTIYTFVNAATTTNNRVAVTGSTQSLTVSNTAQQYNTGTIINFINNDASMDFGEFLSYNTELSLSQQQLIEGYLAWKWGLNTSLPVTHPFYFGPPTTPNITPVTNPFSISLDPISSGNFDIFVALYDQSGLIQWAARMGASANDYGYSVSTDTSSNVYIGGAFIGFTLSIYSKNATLPFLNLSGNGTWFDTFLVKYNSIGFVLWAARSSGSGTGGHNTLNGICVDSDANIYGTGVFSSGTINFWTQGAGTSAFSLTKGTGSGSAFLVKYDTNGTALWGARMIGNGYDVGNGVVVSGTAVTLVGSFTSATLTIHNSTPGGTSARTLSNPSNTFYKGVLLANYTTGGSSSWAARMLGDNSDTEGNAIAVDKNGNLYITGYFTSSTMDFFSAGSSTRSSFLTGSGTNVFTAMYLSGGTFFGRIKMSNGTGRGIAVDSNLNVYVTGNYTSNPFIIFNQNNNSVFQLPNNEGSNSVFIVKYGSSFTSVLWAIYLLGSTGSNSDIGYSISVDSLNNITVTGQYTSTTLNIYNQNGVLLGSILGNGNQQCFIIKLTDSGNLIWAARTVQNNSSIGVSTTSSGTNNFITGVYSTTPLILNSAGL